MFRYRERVLICNDRDQMERLADEFLSEKPKKRVFGSFRIEGNELNYYSSETVKGDWDAAKNERKPDRVEKTKTTIAIKNESITIGNSAILPEVGRTMAWGNEQQNTTQTVIQRVLETRIPMVPFNALEQADLDPRKIKPVEMGKPEKVTRKVKTGHNWQTGKDTFRVETVHFTGAALFKCEEKYFLFDIDRRETKHRILNPFMVELKGKPKSIKAAYESLKPKEVKAAEKKGLKVLRQGEWFFIPSKAPKLPKMSDKEKLIAVLGQRLWGEQERLLGSTLFKEVKRKADKLADLIPKRISLKAGDNRPNKVKLGITKNNTTYCTGEVEHSGREHAKLNLKQWYIAVPNTAVKSVTVTGDID